MVRPLSPLFLLLLAACGDAAAPDGPPPRDPAVAAALAEPLLSDPDLAGSSRSGTALTGGGPATGGVPLITFDSAAADAARSDARELIGGPIDLPPQPLTGAEQSPLARAPTAAAVAAALPFSQACAQSLDYSFAWAARLPAPLPIYPRAHAQEAGGTDQAGCRLRVVNFHAAVRPDEVIAFYLASAAKAGLSADYRREGTDLVLRGSKAGLNYALFVRPLDDGRSEVDLIVNG
jgi:hypothetical protein